MMSDGCPLQTVGIIDQTANESDPPGSRARRPLLRQRAQHGSFRLLLTERIHVSRALV